MAEPDVLDRPDDPEFMASLARGLAVMRCVAGSEQPLTIADAARMTSLSRASVRRCLYTLVQLGYVAQDSTGYRVRRDALALGHPQLSMSSLAASAQARLDRLRTELGESCSLGVLDQDELCYVARAEAVRVMSIGLKVGSRLPLYCTSMGRVLLAGRSAAEQASYLDRTNLRQLTPRTVVSRHRLADLLQEVAAAGYALVDQELEIGLRSIAVPVRRRGQVIAALNVGTAAFRVTSEELVERILPALMLCASELGD